MRQVSRLDSVRKSAAIDDEAPFLLVLLLMALSVAATTIGVLLSTAIHI